MGYCRWLVDGFLKLVYSEVVEGCQPKLVIAMVLLEEGASYGASAYNFLRLL